MTSKPEWLYKQSAVIPYVLEEDSCTIVLVTNNSKRSWIYPKGVIEKDMSPEDSAAKEALEEAGVIGDVESTLLDKYEYEKWGGVCSVKVFPLDVVEILDDWDEKGMRERVLVDIDQAIRQVKPEQQNALMELKQHLQ